MLRFIYRQLLVCSKGRCSAAHLVKYAGFSLSSVGILYGASMAKAAPPATTIFGFEANDIDGNLVHLSKYNGFVTLIVNVASKWGFTKKNYYQLQDLHSRYAEKGLRILAFPCNQFGGQEPGSEEEIKEFVKAYDVEFDMFSKIDVNGSNAHPLYVFLKNAKHGTLTNNIKWNFTKFLCDKHGVPVKRYSPTVSPLDLIKDIEKELNKE